MGRWQPNAQHRLAKAALELFAEHGYEPTTVAQIAERAGLTERTFFRHYADKREVLFAGSRDLQDACVTAVADAPESATPLEALGAGLDAAGLLLADRREHARHRQTAVDSHASLRERELIKMAALAEALADALRERGVPDPGATLLAEAGVAVFKNAFARWLAEDETRPLPALITDSLGRLRDLTAAG